MAADIYNLQNIQPLELNTSYLNDTGTIAQSFFDITYANVGDAWFYISITCLFLFFNWLFYRREENFGYDIARSLMIGSGFCFFISVGMLLSGWIFTILPHIWFGSILFLSFVFVYSLKQRGG